VVAFKVRNKDDHTFTQFACHPRTANYISVIFDTDALVDTLGSSMSVGNYSIELHRALAKAKEYFPGNKCATNERLIKLQKPHRRDATERDLAHDA